MIRARCAFCVRHISYMFILNSGFSFTTAGRVNEWGGAWRSGVLKQQKIRHRRSAPTPCGRCDSTQRRSAPVCMCINKYSVFAARESGSVGTTRENESGRALRCARPLMREGVCGWYGITWPSYWMSFGVRRRASRRAAQGFRNWWGWEW